MSYEDPAQSLKDPIDTIIEGIKNFSEAVNARETSNEWKDEHLDELCEIDLLLRQIRTKLARLRQSTW
jgi:hypothetical protein